MHGQRWMSNLTVLVLLVVLIVAPAAAQEEAGPPPDEPEHWAGVELAEAVSQTTGIAISPLLGVGALGAWTWFRSPATQRDGLPWFAQIWFWLPALVIVVLIVAKDPLLGFLPIIKKPLDALDVVEDKISAVLASAVVIPMLFAVLSQTVPSQSIATNGGSPSLWAITMPAFLSGVAGKVIIVLGVIGMMAAFLVTWLAAHTINVLILLSPFGPLDMLLRALKGLVLLVLLIATLIAPILGAIVSLLIVIVAWRVGGWSFRFGVFGSVFAWDTLFFSHRRLDAATDPIQAFSGPRLADVPPRTYGELQRADREGEVFVYRPCLVLAERRLPLPGRDRVIGKGLLAPIMIAAEQEESPGGLIARFPPRFRGHEEVLAARLNASKVRLLGVRRHFSTLRRWLREIVSGDGEAVAE